MQNERTYKNIRKKSTVRVKDTPVLSVNLGIPVFDMVSSTRAEKRFVENINRFYEKSAENYLKFAAGKFSGKAAALYAKNGQNMCGLVMNTSVAYSSDVLVSVFSDISFFDGENIRKKRYAQLWSCEKASVLPVGFVFRTGMKQKKYVLSLITAIANHNASTGLFTYFDNYPALIRKHFDFSHAYFVPNGVAFYYDAGVLSAKDPEPAVFVVTYEKIDGVVKINNK